jgi:putative heme-binding domain-containing protein
LTAPIVLAGLDDPHPRVREHAVRLAERQKDDSVIASKLCGLTDDRDARVRYQLAFSLGEFSGADRDAALARLARRDGADPLMRTALFSSLYRGAGNVLAELLRDEAARGTQPVQIILEQLANQIGRQGDAAEWTLTEQALTALPDNDPAVTTVVRGLVAGRAKVAPAAQAAPLGKPVATALARLLEAANRQALDETQPVAERAEAVRTLGLGTFAAGSRTLSTLLENRHPQEVQLAVVETCGKFDDPKVGEILTEAWPRMSPRLRAAASEVLFSRAAWLNVVLDAIDGGRLAVGDLDSARLKLLESHAQPEIRERAERLVAALGQSPRQEVVAAYQPALTLVGRPARGRTHFQKICASCHRLEGIGSEVGPNLAAFKNRGAEAILLNLLDPNREVNPQYVNYIAILNDGRTLSGMIVGETATAITLRRAENANDTIERGEIDALRSTRQSLMPEGLEKQLDPQGVADVIAYLLAVP